MTDITKLADKWIDSIDGDSYYTSAWRGQVLNDCANELTEALPKWTRISEDESTWPEDAQPIYIAPTNGGHPATFTGWSSGDKLQMAQLTNGRWSWRPLCSIDYPPEQSK